MGLYQAAGMAGRSIADINLANKLGVSHEALIKARQMSRTFNDSGYIESILEGSFEAAESLVTGIGYASYDFLDQGDVAWKREALDRLLVMIIDGRVNINNLKKIIHIIYAFYFKLISNEERNKLATKLLSKKVTEMTLSMIIAEKFGINALIKVESFWMKIALKKGVMSVMAIPVIKAKSAYKSRELREKIPELYWELRKNGDLDLLYFMMEPYVGIYIDVIYLYYNNRPLFNEITSLYIDMIKA